jgi:UDP-GlcNAc:undecaprenyl-phosphate GlcNAc-1-phosphate transferase
MKAFFLLILAAAVSTLVIPLAWRIAPWLGMIDLPDERKVHTAPVPRIGGWGIAAGCIVPLVLIHELTPLLQSFLIGVGTLFLFGLWDDARQISHWPKFVGQIIATATVVFYGGLYVTRIPFFDTLILSPVVGQLLTMVAMIGVINALNHSDGLDGLAGGETLLSMVALAFLGHLAGDSLVVDIALATIGGTLGFLRFNTHPAQVFMGDSGSQVLGFALSFIVVLLTQMANQATSAALPLLLLGLPISDILVVLYLRASGGLNWFKATRNHVHHRLLDLGFTHFDSVVCIYLLQAMLVISAVLLQYESDLLVTATYLLPIAALFTVLRTAENRGWKKSTLIARLLPGDLPSRLPGATLRRATLGFIGTLVPLLLLLPTIWATTIPRDIGSLAALFSLPLAAVLVWDARRQRAFGAVIIRAITYVGAAFATYVYIKYPGPNLGVVAGAVNWAIVALAVAVGVFARFLSAQKFATTPTDYLIALGLVVLAIIGSIDVTTGNMIQFVTYVIVLFYGCEVVAGHVSRWRLVLGWPTLATLAVLAVRGLIHGG